MTNEITVVVNNLERTIPEDFGSSPDEFLDSMNYQSQKYSVYREGVREKDGTLLVTAKCEEPMVVSEGDSFTVIPKYVEGGG